MPRSDGRKSNQLRPIRMVRGFTDAAPGSVLIQCGRTHVLCTVIAEPGVPDWKIGTGGGWITAEYDMLPGSTGRRKKRTRHGLDGRTQEIQRLIGRALRAVVDLAKLGELTLFVDCDVLQADGGTRSASITGAYVALCDAVDVCVRKGMIAASPVTDSVAAVSAGRVGGKLLLDLDYREDSTAEVDFNLIMTGSGRLVEIQGCGEGATFSVEDLMGIMQLANKGIRELTKAQLAALGLPSAKRE